VFADSCPAACQRAPAERGGPCEPRFPATPLLRRFPHPHPTHLDGLAEVAGVRVVLKGVGAHKHHIQRHAAAPHVSGVPVVRGALQHLRGPRAAGGGGGWVGGERRRQNLHWHGSMRCPRNAARSQRLQHVLVGAPPHACSRANVGSAAAPSRNCRPRSGCRHPAPLPAAAAPLARCTRACRLCSSAGCRARSCCSQSRRFSGAARGCHPAACSLASGLDGTRPGGAGEGRCDLSVACSCLHRLNTPTAEEYRLLQAQS
jgi:hypothetical protein